MIHREEREDAGGLDEIEGTGGEQQEGRQREAPPRDELAKEVRVAREEDEIDALVDHVVGSAHRAEVLQVRERDVGAVVEPRVEDREAGRHRHEQDLEAGDDGDEPGEETRSVHRVDHITRRSGPRSNVDLAGET